MRTQELVHSLMRGPMGHERHDYSLSEARYLSNINNRLMYRMGYQFHDAVNRLSPEQMQEQGFLLEPDPAGREWLNLTHGGNNSTLSVYDFNLYLNYPQSAGTWDMATVIPISPQLAVTGLRVSESSAALSLMAKIGNQRTVDIEVLNSGAALMDGEYDSGNVGNTWGVSCDFKFKNDVAGHLGTTIYSIQSDEDQATEYDIDGKTEWTLTAKRTGKGFNVLLKPETFSEKRGIYRPVELYIPGNLSNRVIGIMQDHVDSLSGFKTPATYSELLYYSLSFLPKE